MKTFINRNFLVSNKKTKNLGIKENDYTEPQYTKNKITRGKKKLNVYTYIN